MLLSRLSSRLGGSSRSAGLLVRPELPGLSARRRFCSGEVVVSGPPIHLDYQWLRENVDLVSQHVEQRRFSQNCDPQQVVSLYDRWRDQSQLLDQLRAQRKAVAAQISVISAAERPALMEQGRQIKAELAELATMVTELQQSLLAEAVRVPNLSHPETPVGPETEARVLEEVGQTPEPAQQAAQHHYDWMLEHGMVDMEAASRASGPRFMYFTKEAALLELALINWAVQRAAAHGFSPAFTPDLVHGFVITGCGFNPRGRDSQVYKVTGEDLYLSGTAEVPLAGRHADALLEESALPLKSVGFGRAYRKEVGNSSAQTRGIYRVHQFSKVELFAICTAQQSPQLFEEILKLQKSMFSELGLHYRVLEMPTEELGAPAFRKIDIEAWMPGMNKWGEISSTSTCTDYQSRRLNIRHNRAAEEPAEDNWFAAYQSPGQRDRPNPYAHTLNGTACAIPRTMIALIEQGMQSDGTVRIPEVLRPFMLGQSQLPFPQAFRLP